MNIELGYGTGKQSAIVPDENILQILTPNKVDLGNAPVGADSVREALAHPIGTPRLGEIIKPGEKVAIITSDISRPMPTRVALPPLLDELFAAGARAEDITLVFALGSHRHQTEEERRKLAGDFACDTIRCVDSDPEDCIHLGETSNGTPIDITRVVAEADRRICLGNIEYHYFAGYSGGIKAIFPGCSTPAAIQANHSMMILPDAHTGKLDGNPLRADLEEAAALCPVDFLVNVVLNEKKEIIYTVCGDLTKAHRRGCAFLDSLYSVPVKEKADIVIVSQGGAPKDLNLYQTQKALDNSKHAVKDGGTIILVGSCREGFGNKTFEKWIADASKPSDLTDRIKRDFKLGGHKAAAIAMVMEKANIKLVSDMDDATVRQVFMEPYADLQSAVDDAFAEQRAVYGAGATHSADGTGSEHLAGQPSVIVMPYGGSTLPIAE